MTYSDAVDVIEDSTTFDFTDAQMWALREAYDLPQSPDAEIEVPKNWIFLKSDSSAGWKTLNGPEFTDYMKDSSRYCSNAEFPLLVMGRRSGKSTLSCLSILMEMLDGMKRGADKELCYAPLTSDRGLNLHSNLCSLLDDIGVSYSASSNGLNDFDLEIGSTVQSVYVRSSSPSFPELRSYSFDKVIIDDFPPIERSFNSSRDGHTLTEFLELLPHSMATSLKDGLIAFTSLQGIPQNFSYRPLIYGKSWDFLTDSIDFKHLMKTWNDHPKRFWSQYGSVPIP